MSRYQKLVKKVHAYLTAEREKKGLWSRFISDRFFDSEYWRWHRHCVAVGVGWGAFFSVAPLPMQCLWGAGFSVWKKGNIPVAVLSAWLSPPGFVFVAVPLQWWLGTCVMKMLGLATSGLSFHAMKTLADERSMSAFRVLRHQMNFPLVLWEFFLGVVISCTLLGLVCYGTVHLIWLVCSSIRRWVIESKYRRRKKRREGL